MANTTISPNMNLPIPIVGVDPGPQYASDVDSCLTILDQHNHSPGSGVQITPDGLNINSTLSFGSNFASNLAGLTLVPQTSTPAINTIYESGVDLYYVDGLGNNVRITQSGAVAGTPGSIANLVPPASASYVAGSSTFVWQSNTSIAANMDFGAAILRNLTPNSTFGVTVQPPAALGSNYTLTVPTIPAVLSFMSLDTSGNMAATVPVSQGLTAANIANQAITATQIANQTITAAQIALLTITAAQIANSTITGGKIVNNVNLPGNTVQENGRNVIVSSTNSTSSLTAIRGSVDSTGAIVAGEGFTVNHSSTGTFIISFTNTFANIPVVVTSVNTPGGGGVGVVTSQTVSASVLGVTVLVYTGTVTLTNQGFAFIAIGAR